MSLFTDFLLDIVGGVALSQQDEARCAAIMSRVRGYSDGKHYAFFKALLARPEVKDVLILGVYHGRDIAFMRDCLLSAGRIDVWIVGVDKFSDTPCADWPAGSIGKSWQDAGFGPPPDIEQARRNCGAETSGPVLLSESDDERFLAHTEGKFDAVYLDTSHDFATVNRQLKQVRRVCKPSAIICGDDYSDRGTWGVKRAVTASFNQHTVFAGWIWASGNELLKS